jgi:hypothetical protein
MKSGFWQIRINENDKYKIAFTVSFKHYERNNMSLKLKNALRKFQNDMNNIFTHFINFSINNVLIFYKQNWKYLQAFVQIINNNRLIISPNKINLSLNNIHFLDHIIVQIIIINKFLDKIKEKNQSQRFIRSLNYISDYYKHFRIICKSHYQELKKNSPLWSNQHTEIIRHIQICLGFPTSNTFRIVETNAPKIGRECYVYLVCYHSDIWYTPQNYSIIKK